MKSFKSTVARLAVGLVAAAGLAGATGHSVSAASGPVALTACVTGPSSTVIANSSVYSYWYNGSGWVPAQAFHVNANGCVLLTLQHNGYYFISMSGYSFGNCQEYTYAWTGQVIKQNLPSGARLNRSLIYQGALAAC